MRYRVLGTVPSLLLLGIKHMEIKHKYERRNSTITQCVVQLPGQYTTERLRDMSL